MTTDTLTGSDLYLKVIPKSGGRPTIREHRVWDGARFFAAQVHAHNNDKTKPEDRASVEIATRADYLQSRKST